MFQQVFFFILWLGFDFAGFAGSRFAYASVYVASTTYCI